MMTRPTVFPVNSIQSDREALPCSSTLVTSPPTSPFPDQDGRPWRSVGAPRSQRDPDLPPSPDVTAVPGARRRRARRTRTTRTSCTTSTSRSSPSAALICSPATAAISTSRSRCCATKHRDAYRAYGLGRGSLRRIYRPATIKKYVQLMRAGQEAPAANRRHPPTRWRLRRRRRRSAALRVSARRARRSPAPGRR